MLRYKSAFLQKVKPRNRITPAEELIKIAKYRFYSDTIFIDIDEHPDHNKIYDSFMEIIEVPQSYAFCFDTEFHTRFLDKEALVFKKLCEEYQSLEDRRLLTQSLKRKPRYSEIRNIKAFSEKQEDALRSVHPNTWFFKMIYCPKNHGVQPLSDEAWSELVDAFENGETVEKDDDYDDYGISGFNETRQTALQYKLDKDVNLTATLTQNIKTSFLMSETEVSQALWGLVMGEFHPYFMDGRMSPHYNYPINYISFCDMLVFCNRLSIIYGLEPCYKLEGVEYLEMSLMGIYNASSYSRFDFDIVKAFKDQYWIEYLTRSEIRDLEDEGRLYPDDPNFENIFRSIKAATVTWDKSANGFRLPTKAEWEYAASAGIDTLYPGCSEGFLCFKDFVSFDLWLHDGGGRDEDDEEDEDDSWSNDWSDDYSKTRKYIYDTTRLDALDSVGKPNAWGFRGMSGNVSNAIWPKSTEAQKEILTKEEAGAKAVKTKGGHKRSEYVDFLITSDVDDVSRDYFQSFRIVRNPPLDIFFK